MFSNSHFLTIKKTYLGIVTLGLVLSVFAHAQTQPAPEGSSTEESTEVVSDEFVGDLLSAVYEQRVSKIIGRHLSPTLFQVKATVEAASVSEEYDEDSYLPSNVDRLSFGSASSKALKEASASIAITIFIDSRVQADAKTQLKDIVVKIMEFDGSEKIDFVDLNFQSLDYNNNEQRDALKKAELLGGENQALLRERDDVKRELDITNSSLGKQSREIEGLKSLNQKMKIELQKSTQETQSAKSDASSKLREIENLKIDQATQKEEKVWITGAALIVMAIIIVIGLIMIGLSFKSSGSNVGESVTAVAAALDTIGASVTTLGESEKEEAIEAAEDGLGEAESTLSPSQVDPAAVEKKLSELSAWINERLEDNVETTILDLINKELITATNPENAVGMLEVLGKESAGRLYDRLSKKAQSKIRDFIQNGVYSRPKSDVMLDGAEKLKTAIFFSSSVENTESAKAVILGLVKLDVVRVVMLLEQVDSEAMPRLLSYFDAKSIAQFIKDTKENNADIYDKLVVALSDISPTEESVEQFDKIIATSIEEVASIESVDRADQFKLYSQIFANIPDNLIEEISTKLAEKDDDLKAFVEENVITAKTLYLLSEEVQSEVFDYLSNKDIAAIMNGGDDQFSALATLLLDKRKFELLDDEILRINSKGKRVAEGENVRAQKLIIKKIKILKGAGSLRALMAEANETADGGDSSQQNVA
jgi:hypothetical protein